VLEELELEEELEEELLLELLLLEPVDDDELELEDELDAEGFESSPPQAVSMSGAATSAHLISWLVLYRRCATHKTSLFIGCPQ